MLCPRTWLPKMALMAGIGFCTAFGPAATHATAGDEGDLADEPQAAREGILVMRNGAIVSGKIMKSGTIYEVQCLAGRMAVPENLVRLRCANVSEAYEKLHASAAAQEDADSHLMLARWCLTNHLEREARRELQAALALEPDREEAKRLLRSVDELLSPSRQIVKVASQEDPVRAARIAAAAAADETVSLGGLTRENASQFARRIQPLLVGNCTAAGCHGRDSQTNFRLTRVTPGRDSNRHAAERNLIEVLALIDVARPRASPLLTVPRNNHGRRGKPIFSGPRGEEQLAELRKWVIAVSREEAVREKLGKRRDKEGPVRPASSRETRGEPSRLQAAGGLSSVKPFDDGAESDESDSPQRPLPAAQDPFDPAAFNKSAAPRPRR
jgi:hypothetical protein